MLMIKRGASPALKIHFIAHVKNWDKEIRRILNDILHLNSGTWWQHEKQHPQTADTALCGVQGQFKGEIDPGDTNN